jgi:hypothetical protein
MQNTVKNRVPGIDKKFGMNDENYMLPNCPLQSRDMSEMAVAANQREVILFAQGCDPEVVVWDHLRLRR